MVYARQMNQREQRCRCRYDNDNMRGKTCTAAGKVCHPKWGTRAAGSKTDIFCFAHRCDPLIARTLCTLPPLDPLWPRCGVPCTCPSWRCRRPRRAAAATWRCRCCPNARRCEAAFAVPTKERRDRVRNRPRGTPFLRSDTRCEKHDDDDDDKIYDLRDPKDREAGNSDSL